MEEVDEFNKISLDLKNIDIKIKVEEYAILLLSSLPRSFEHFIDTMQYGETLMIDEVKSALNSNELQRKHNV